MKMSSSLNERNVISNVTSSPVGQTYDKARSFYRSVGNRAARNISATKTPRGAITAFLFSSAFSPRCTWSDTYPALVVYLRFFLPDSLVKTLGSMLPACDLKCLSLLSTCRNLKLVNTSYRFNRNSILMPYF